MIYFLAGRKYDILLRNMIYGKSRMIYRASLGINDINPLIPHRVYPIASRLGGRGIA